MVVTRRCNLSCKYCSEFDKTSLPVPIEQLKRQVRKLNELGTLSLVMTGGEPLLHPNIYDLIRYSKRYIFKIGITTNGFMLTKERILKLNASNLYELQISIDGVNPNKTTIKVLKYLKDKLLLLKKYAKFKIHINTVIGPTDPKEALETIKFSNELNFNSTIGLIHDDNGQIHLNENQRKKYFLSDKLRKKPLWDIYNFEKTLIEKGECQFKCRAGSRYLYIDEFGIAHWCSQKRDVFQKPLMDYSFNDLKTQFYQYKKCSRKCTLGCVRKASFFDTWRKQNICS